MMHLNALPNHRPEEKVVLFLRRHWIVVLKLAVAFGFMTLLPLGAIAVFWSTFEPLFTHPTWGPLLVLCTGGYMMSVWLFAYSSFTDYYLDTWIVTNERILNIEQNGLFSRTTSELHLATVQDVTSTVSGMFHTFINYGDVNIQTAAEKERFFFEEVPNPDEVKNTIIRLIDEDKSRHGDQSLPPGV